jgi:hypothetical protein
MSATDTTTLKPYLVTTEYRGVFFGYADDTSGDTITLKNARNCIYWPPTQGGFMGLAADGPAKGARIGATADIELRKITSILPVSETAAKRWVEADVYCK